MSLPRSSGLPTPNNGGKLPSSGAQKPPTTPRAPQTPSASQTNGMRPPQAQGRPPAQIPSAPTQQRQPAQLPPSQRNQPAQRSPQTQRPAQEQPVKRPIQGNTAPVQQRPPVQRPPVKRPPAQLPPSRPVPQEQPVTPDNTQEFNEFEDYDTSYLDNPQSTEQPSQKFDQSGIDENSRIIAEVRHNNEIKKLQKETPKKGEGVPESVVKESLSESQKMNLIKYLVIGVFLISIAGNFKTLFFSDSIPSDLELAGRVTYAMNKTTFPVEKGEGFAQEFLAAYLTNSKDIPRKEVLSDYISGSFDDGNPISFPQNYTQTVTKGPYNYGVRYVTDDVAIFTLGAEINGTHWEYYAVNVYYDRSGNKGFSIPKTPTIVPVPETGTAPTELEVQNVNEEASASAKTVVDAYFSAWVNGNMTELDVTLSADATYAARNSGLSESGIKFNTVQKLEVVNKSDESPTYFAVANVVLEKPIDGIEDGKITYNSHYELILEYAGSGNKWLVKDIRPYEYKPDLSSSNEE